MEMMRYMLAGRRPLVVVPPHVMGGHQCLYLEQMISGRVDVTAMDANAIVKQVQRSKELVTLLIIPHIASTNTYQVNLIQYITKYH